MGGRQLVAGVGRRAAVRAEDLLRFRRATNRACSRRAGATKGTTATARSSSCSPSRRAAISGSRWPAARRGPFARRFHATCWSTLFVNLFEVTGSRRLAFATQLDPTAADAERTASGARLPGPTSSAGSTPRCAGARSLLRRNPDRAPGPVAGPLVVHCPRSSDRSRSRRLKTPLTVVPSATTVTRELDVVLLDGAFEVGLAVAPFVGPGDLLAVLLEGDERPCRCPRRAPR